MKKQSACKGKCTCKKPAVKVFNPWIFTTILWIVVSIILASMYVQRGLELERMGIVYNNLFDQQFFNTESAATNNLVK